jgi:hypothetical protein
VTRDRPCTLEAISGVHGTLVVTVTRHSCPRNATRRNALATPGDPARCSGVVLCDSRLALERAMNESRITQTKSVFAMRCAHLRPRAA